LRKFNIDQRDSREFNNFYLAVIFVALSEKHSLKQKLVDEFPEGERFSREEVLEKMNKVFTMVNIALPPVKTPAQAVRLFKLFFRQKKKYAATKEEGSTFEVLGFNPLKIKVKKILDERTNIRTVQILTITVEYSIIGFKRYRFLSDRLQ
jgi:hypothetical protein